MPWCWMNKAECRYVLWFQFYENHVYFKGKKNWTYQNVLRSSLSEGILDNIAGLLCVSSFSRLSKINMYYLL